MNKIPRENSKYTQNGKISQIKLFNGNKQCAFDGSKLLRGTNSAESELINSIRANDVAKEHIRPPPQGYAGRRNVWNSIQ